VNPLFLSALFGAAKGAAAPGHQLSGSDAFQAYVMAPLSEEAVYRAAPAFMGFPRGLSALTFAVDHLVSDSRRQPFVSGYHAATRFADVFAGGLLYEAAYRRWGFLGAALTHAMHNIMVGVGSRASGALGLRPAVAQAPHRLHRLRVKRRG